jgi:hypothetical protein
LYELTRFGGRLTFLDTGINARVTGPGRSAGRGDFVIAPDIQVFSTFAAFMPASRSDSLFSDVTEWDTETNLQTPTQQPTGRLYFPALNQANNRQARISIANPETSGNLNVTFTGYNEAGAVIRTQSRTVNANRQSSFLISQLFPGFTSGMIVAEGRGAAMTGFFEIADSFTPPTALAGAEGVAAPPSALLFPIIKSAGGGFTEVRVSNPNASAVTIKLAGFTSAGARVNPTNASGQPLGAIMLPPFGTLALSSTGPPGAVQLGLNLLDGGSIVVQAMGGAGVVGGELFGEVIDGQRTLAVLNALPYPVGCLPSTTDPCACHVDTTVASPTPSAVRQHTQYAIHFEENPSQSVLYFVNASDSPAPLALSAFSEAGQFRASSPARGFMTLNPHQVFQATATSLFGFNPAPGYVRVEDPNSSFVGAVINRVGRSVTVVPLSPDDPRSVQTATNTYFSRIQLDPANSDPRLTTGLLVFNQNNNTLQLVITVTDSRGSARRSQQTLAARGVFTRARQSLNALFPNVNLNDSYAQVEVTGAIEPGAGGRAIPLAVYRVISMGSTVVSAVPPQNRQPNQ